MKKGLLVLIALALLVSTTVFAQSPGVTCEYWNGQTLTDPALLAKNSNLLGAPTSTETLTVSFMATTNRAGAPFVARCTSVVTIPETGNYTFWIAANKLANLYFTPTTNISRSTPFCRVSANFPTPTARQWTRNLEQKSSLIPLTAGAKYIATVIYVATSSTNHLAVGWQLPSLVYERPIPASRLQQPGLPAGVSFTSNKTTMVQGQAATLTWSSSNTTSCTASSSPAYQYWTGTKTVSGTQYVTPLQDTSFTLTCSGFVYTGTASLSVLVTPAQTLNPTKVEFDPSADHNTIVVGYELQFYLLGASASFQNISMGKPTPSGTTGKILVDWTTLPGVIVSWPLSVGEYQAKVAAWAADSSYGLSDFSNVFTISR